MVEKVLKRYRGSRLLAERARCLATFEDPSPPRTPWSDDWFNLLSEQDVYLEAERTQRRIAAGLQPVDTYRKVK